MGARTLCPAFFSPVVSLWLSPLFTPQHALYPQSSFLTGLMWAGVYFSKEVGVRLKAQPQEERVMALILPYTPETGSQA